MLKNILKTSLICLLFSFALHSSVLAEPTIANKNQTLSLSFQDIKVRSALQLLAKFAGINLIISDKVNGNMSLQLEKIAWPQALDLILTTQGLAKRQIGNVYIIAPLAELASQEQQEAAALELAQNSAPLQASLLQINYGKANDLAATLKDKNNSLLSKRGTVSVDARTNTLWIQDTPEKLTQIKHFVQLLDIPVQQVIIEARIVNIDHSYEKDLGIRFGISKDIPNTAANASDGSSLHFDTPNTSNLNNVGLAIIKLGDGFLLDLELAALESEGAGEIISSPHLITANQQTAKIEAGTEIPYQEASSSGATSTTFKKAVLALQVTPQITPDKKILLNLKVNQDKPGTTLINQTPTIDTREIETQVMVNNGQTIVLGGIYENRNSQQVQRTPFLSNIPLVGNLFKHTHQTQNRTELLIFVTPKLVTDA